MTEGDFNDARRLVEDYFAAKPPADIVPKPGLEREALLGLNLLAHHDRIVTTQAATLTVDGDTVTVSPAETFTDTVAAPVVTRAALERAGLQPADVPNLMVVD